MSEGGAACHLLYSVYYSFGIVGNTRLQGVHCHGLTKLFLLLVIKIIPSLKMRIDVVATRWNRRDAWADLNVEVEDKVAGEVGDEEEGQDHLLLAVGGDAARARARHAPPDRQAWWEGGELVESGGGEEKYGG